MITERKATYIYERGDLLRCVTEEGNGLYTVGRLYLVTEVETLEDNEKVTIYLEDDTGDKRHPWDTEALNNPDAAATFTYVGSLGA